MGANHVRSNKSDNQTIEDAMTEPFHQKLIQQCADIFHQSIPDIHDQNIPILAAYIVLGHAQSSVEKALDALIKQNVSIHTLLHALMQSQMLLLESRLSNMVKKPLASDIQALKSYIDHVHYMATNMFLIDEKNRLEHSDKEGAETSEDMRIFKDSLPLWQKEEKIKCINFYKGLPVQCMANIDGIIESEDSFISLSLNHDLLRVLIMTNNSYILVPSASDEDMLRLQVHVIGHRTVTLTTKRMSTFKKRKKLRLQPLEPMQVRISHHMKNIGKADVLDFSLTHFNMKMDSDACQSLHIDDIVDIQIPFQDKLTQAAAWIRFMRQDKQYHVLCVEFQTNGEVQRLLQNEVSISQRKIIQEIKEKCALL